MLPYALITVSVMILIGAVWYCAFLRVTRRRALLVLRWLEEAIVTHGQISGIEWVSRSHFRARLHLPGSAFRQPSLDARFAPREMPVKWALWRWQRRQETLTFEANLACPPRHSMEIGRTRWTGLTRRWTRSTGDFISTQPEWEAEISSRMTTAVSTRELEFLGVSFRPRAPHFSVTFSLHETLKQPIGEATIFDSVRELAGSSTSRM